MPEDTQHRIRQPSDLNEIRTIAQGILGKICADVDLGYAEELYIYIGDPMPPRATKKRNFVLYEWELASRGTNWQLTRLGNVIVTSQNTSDKIREETQSLKGAQVLSFEIGYPNLGLTITFDNGYELAIQPTSEDAVCDLAYWQLFTPTMMLLEVGPGPFWSYTRADLP